MFFHLKTTFGKTNLIFEEIKEFYLKDVPWLLCHFQVFIPKIWLQYPKFSNFHVLYAKIHEILKIGDFESRFSGEKLEIGLKVIKYFWNKIILSFQESSWIFKIRFLSAITWSIKNGPNLVHDNFKNVIAFEIWTIPNWSCFGIWRPHLEKLTWYLKR